MTRLRDREGGALTKVLATLLVLALLASAALFVYTRSQDPLALGVDASVGYNAVLADHGTPSDPLVKLEPNGQIYLATTVRNEGSLPITITGLGQPPADEQTPYVPVELHLGDGKTADPAGSTSGFEPTRLNPGTGIGVLVVFAANSKLICSVFTDTSEGSGTEIRSFTLKYTTYGIPDSQTLDVGHTLVAVARPTRTECEQALGG
ncbi:MAG: hypothetical protein E6G58_04670 [Actinobacteria bacterium]|nr:MAG: hypothetical protein E6G58_04670 [Actinomycetota bacterium]